PRMRAASTVYLEVAGPLDDDGPVLELGDGRHDRPHLPLVAAADPFRPPIWLRDAVRHVDDLEAHRRLGCGKCRHHRVEVRQGERRADTAEDSASWKGQLRDNHDGQLLTSARRIWNGAL